MSEEHKKIEIAESYNNSSKDNIKKERFLKRKKKRINRLAFNNLNKEFDLGRIKNKLTKILEEENSSKNDDQMNVPINNLIKKITNVKDTGIFLTTNIVTFIKKISQEQDKIPEDYKSLELAKTLFKITKSFLFNDFELLNFSIYLDKLAWDHKSLHPEEFLYVLGLAVKIQLVDPNNKRIFIENLKVENSRLYSKYMEWLGENEQLFSEIRISEKDLNSKYKALSRPPDFFCKSNLVDYNYIVEKILKMSVTYSENKANKDLKNNEIAYKHGNPIDPIHNENDFRSLNPFCNFQFPNTHKQNSLSNYIININNKEAFKFKENFSLNNSNPILNKNSSFNNNEASNSISKNNEFNNINDHQNQNKHNNLNNLKGKNEKILFEKSENVVIDDNENFKNNAQNNFKNDSNKNPNNYEEYDKINIPLYPNGFYHGPPVDCMYPPYPLPFSNVNAAPNEHLNYPFYPPQQVPFNPYNGYPHEYMKQYEEYMKILSSSNTNNKKNNNNHGNPQDFPNKNFPVYPYPPFATFDPTSKHHFHNFNNLGNNFNNSSFDNQTNQGFNQPYIKNNLGSLENKNNINKDRNNLNKEKPNSFSHETLLSKISNYNIIDSNESYGIDLNPEKAENPIIMRHNHNSNFNYPNQMFIEIQNKAYSHNNQKGSSGNFSNDFYIDLERRGDNSNSNNYMNEDMKSHRVFSMANQTNSFPNEEYTSNKYLENLKQMFGNNGNINN